MLYIPLNNRQTYKNTLIVSLLFHYDFSFDSKMFSNLTTQINLAKCWNTHSQKPTPKNQ